MNFRLGYLLIFVLLLGYNSLAGSAYTAPTGIDQLRLSIQARENSPKLYLPDKITVGEPLKMLVIAPGAETITLYGSNEPSGSDFDPALNMQLGRHYESYGTKSLVGDQSRAAFEVLLEDEALINKPFFFEALVTYKDDYGRPRQVKAKTFGANAASLGTRNSILVYGIPKKDPTAQVDVLRSILPGIGQSNFRY